MIYENKEIDHGNGLIEYIFYHTNDKKYIHCSLLNGMYHCEFRCYNTDGTLGLHEYNKKGLVEGEQLRYYYD